MEAAYNTVSYDKVQESNAGYISNLIQFDEFSRYRIRSVDWSGACWVLLMAVVHEQRQTRYDVSGDPLQKSRNRLDPLSDLVCERNVLQPATLHEEAQRLDSDIQHLALNAAWWKLVIN